MKLLSEKKVYHIQFCMVTRILIKINNGRNFVLGLYKTEYFLSTGNPVPAAG